MIKSLLPGNAPGKELEGNQLKATVSICVCWMRGYKVTALCFGPKFQICEDKFELITGISCIFSPKGFVLGDVLGKGALGTDCPASLSAVPRLAQSFNLHFSSFFLPGDIYVCVYTYILMILSPTPSKWCKTSPPWCDFHSLLQRLEVHIGAIPYLTAQYHLSSSSLTSALFPLIAPCRRLSWRQDLLPFLTAQWELPQWAENTLFI